MVIYIVFLCGRILDFSKTSQTYFISLPWTGAVSTNSVSWATYC